LAENVPGTIMEKVSTNKEINEYLYWPDIQTQPSTQALSYPTRCYGDKNSGTRLV
jgi:hypothetical protein